MYKLYTSCLNLFIQDHCESNEIFTHEYVGGKKESAIVRSNFL